MPRSTAEELSMESRRCRIANLFLRGVKRQEELARQVGVNRSTVSRDLKVLNQRWKEAAVHDLDAAKAQELERIDQLEREYWEAWEKSKQAHETTTTEQTTGAAGERLRAGVRKVEQTGDPRYLEGVRWCIARRCALLGLDAPVETRLAGRDGGPVQTVSTVLEMTEDERAAAIAALFARVGQADRGPHPSGPADTAGLPVGEARGADDGGGDDPGCLADGVAPLYGGPPAAAVQPPER
jgi:hypothetical protein